MVCNNCGKLYESDVRFRTDSLYEYKKGKSGKDGIVVYILSGSGWAEQKGGES
jgi:hypothetical protein